LNDFRKASNIAQAIGARRDKKNIKDFQLFSSTLEKLFEEFDMEFGSSSMIFDHRSNDSKSIALLRLQCGEPKSKKGISDIQLELEYKTIEFHGPKQQFLLHITITRQQAYELQEVCGNNSIRLTYLCQKLGVRLACRRGLGSQGDTFVVAIN